jgi:hypothetical protein
MERLGERWEDLFAKRKEGRAFVQKDKGGSGG